MTFNRLRKDRAIFGDEGNESDELESAPVLLFICGEKRPVDMAVEEVRVSGGGGGGDVKKDVVVAGAATGGGVGWSFLAAAAQQRWLW